MKYIDKESVKLFRKASKKLHKEFDEFKCEEKCLGCVQCNITSTMELFDLLINFVDESKWTHLSP